MRTHYSTEIQEPIESVTVSGWVNSIRDHGGVYFIDLRDSKGLIQIVANPTQLSKEEYEKFHQLRDEWVIEVSGEVRWRGEGLENPKLITGKIEVYVHDLEIISKAKTLPFQPGDNSVKEELRLQYRYLDLRSKSLQNTLKVRSNSTFAMRQSLNELGYSEIELPTLIKASEGGAAEVYATSELFPGEFYALPQSPQMYKQLLMIGGVEKYYSFAKCFRAENSRSDRAIEFTQLDMERAFADSEMIIRDTSIIVLNTLINNGKNLITLDLVAENNIKWLDDLGIKGFVMKTDSGIIPVIKYNDAMEYFGSDKPDLRIKSSLIDMATVFKGCDFGVFANAVENKNEVVKALVVKQSDFPDKLSKKKIKDLEKFVMEFGAKGLAYFQMKDDGLKGPLTKFLKQIELDKIVIEGQLEVGDIIFFGAGDKDTVLDYMGRLRIKVAEILDRIENEDALLWVTDFPMFEQTTEGIKSMHHPFTKPTDESWEAYKNGEIDKFSILTDSYDIVYNGVELGGGSVRIHNPEMQKEIFEIMELSEEDLKEKFGFFIEALSYGTPPHAGCAIGLDRFIMLLDNKESLKEVIAFPKNNSAREPMSSSPDKLPKKELRTLGLKARES